KFKHFNLGLSGKIGRRAKKWQLMKYIWRRLICAQCSYMGCPIVNELPTKQLGDHFDPVKSSTACPTASASVKSYTRFMNIRIESVLSLGGKVVEKNVYF
ncbi:MAG: hypothetical protein Q8L02_03100, partial [Candidatus Nitrotoga sp.]|nr:hypothetical protein [Candidatus Nitrotoga sp.]